MCELDSAYTGTVPIGTVTLVVRIGLAFPRDCLERFHLGMLIVSKWVCFRSRSQVELYSRKRVEQFQMGLDWK